MFKRPMNILTRELMKKQYRDVLNKDNISKLSRRKINEILKDESEKHKLQYLHLVLDEWTLKGDIDIIRLKLLKKIIRKNKIVLNEIERHNLVLIEERAFSIERHIKVLEVSQNLRRKETVGVKFVNTELYRKTKSLRLLGKGNLLLTNERIIFLNDEEISFDWKKITKIEYHNYGFQFKFASKLFVIRIHDQETLNNTVKNFTDKKVN